jgi:hypothetical protein
MSAVTPVMVGMVGDLIKEILLIVGSLAAIVGISILVAFGFKKLRSVGSK